jgi:hypothetical protein
VKITHLPLLVALAAVALAVPGLVIAGEDTQTRIPYRALTWTDFRIDDEVRGTFRETTANTNTFLAYRAEYRANAAGRDRATAFVKQIVWEGGFDRSRSWRRSFVRDDDTRTLRHEQGHLDVNEIKIRELKALALTAYPTGTGKTPDAANADLRVKVQALYARHRDELQVVQNRYETETRHGTLPGPQDAWNAKLTAG